MSTYLIPNLHAFPQKSPEKVKRWYNASILSMIIYFIWLQMVTFMIVIILKFAICIYIVILKILEFLWYLFQLRVWGGVESALLKQILQPGNLVSLRDLEVRPGPGNTCALYVQDTSTITNKPRNEIIV